MFKYTKVPANTFKNLQMNAGILLKNFTVNDGSFQDSDLIGATTGGLNFTATPTFEDFGEDVDNCPKNTKELKKLTDWEVKLSGTLVTLTGEVAKTLTAVADYAANKVTPRSELELSDFEDLWMVCDYTDVNTGDNAGYIAIHMMNALSTSGFQIQTTDKGKGQFAFEFTGHYSIDAQDTVPFEIYVKEGTVNG